MAQDKKQEPDQQRVREKKKQYTENPQQKSNVDLASINASGTDESGEFVREGKKRERKKDTRGNAEQEAGTKNTAASKSPEGRENKKGYVVPVLRTYHQDTKHMAQTKGGAELRTILAKEAEEKQRAQEEYLRKTKDVMKESMVLRDRYNNFTQKREEQSIETPAPKTPDSSTKEESVDQESITRVLSGATTYMQSVRDDTAKKQKESSKKPVQDAITIETERQPKPAPPTEDIETETSGNKEAAGDQTEKKKGIFARVRGRMLPKDIFTEEKRESLRQKQQEVVEKEAIQDAWKDFRQKKKKLQEMGMQARNVRSYAASPDETIPNKPLKRQNMMLLAIVFFLLTGLILSVVFLALSPTEEPVVINDTVEAAPVPDVINSENAVFVDISDTATLHNTWQSITEKDGEPDTVTKYVPYAPVEESGLQINFKDFSDTFAMRFPLGLRNAFDDYYFVGKYVTQTEANGIFIASIKKYGDAFVWIRNWEKDAINAFSAVFPNSFRQSKASNVTVESRIIDNQDVRVIRNPTSQKEMFYYFFGRSILVIIVGEESVIPLVNARIRSANTF